MRECDHWTDVLVVGSGNGGMTAAVSAHVMGGGDVLVIEQAQSFGGTSAGSGGVVWIPNNPYAREDGSEDSIEDAFAYLDSVLPEDISRQLVRTFLSEGPEMMTFLRDHTEVRYQNLPTYPDYFTEKPGAKLGGRSMESLPINRSDLGDEASRIGTATPMALIMGRFAITMKELVQLMSHGSGSLGTLARIFFGYYLDLPYRVRGRLSRRLTLGQAGVARLRLSLMKRNIPIWYGAAMKSLVKENGRVVGVVATKNGKDIRIRAHRGVVLACGGFEQNQALREKYLPLPTDARWSATPPCNTGAALIAGQEIGAATARLGHAWWCTTLHAPDEDRPRLCQFEKSMPGNYTLGSDGRRIANESQNYMTYMLEYHEAHRNGKPVLPCFMVFDSRHRKNYFVGSMPPGKVFPDFMIKKSYFETGFLYRADTIENLAEKTGIDREGLLETVAKVNGYAKTGKDLEFGRGDSRYDRHYGDKKVDPNPCLGPLDSPPYYAMRIEPGEFGVTGGLVIDTHARVLDRQNEPIPGLYATGNCTTGFLTTYPGAGSTLGPAMTFGYVAAKHLCQAESIMQRPRSWSMTNDR